MGARIVTQRRSAGRDSAAVRCDRVDATRLLTHAGVTLTRPARRHAVREAREMADREASESPWHPPCCAVRRVAATEAGHAGPTA